ncbi:hypothetical protein F4802DRAFT_585265 [Xylaria palmicola]|nr:hypothetical protein F4802DRAFT_585265 [Xylaria palmicola]
MFLSPSPIHKPQCPAPGLSPAGARRGYRRGGLKTERAWLSPNAHKRSQRKTVHVGWDRDEREEDRRLASDPTVELPGEPRRPTPRLERQEAFRAPQTWDILDTDVAVDDAALYRLGILYDDDGDGDGEDEHVRGPGFGLDAIVRAEPAYSLRPAKRVKRAHGRQIPAKGRDLHLSVELLSTHLGDDAAIKNFFALAGDAGGDRFYGGDCAGINLRHGGGSTLRESAARPLTVIYELIEASTHALAPAPAAHDFPDLLPDTEDEECGEAEDAEEGDIRSVGDWALVLGPGSSAGRRRGDADVFVDLITDDREETAVPADGAWVFLAGDDS